MITRIPPVNLGRGDIFCASEGNLFLCQVEDYIIRKTFFFELGLVDFAESPCEKFIVKLFLGFAEIAAYR